ncbi:HypC/HybG/HupF family hydrogenase formation chaperone [uncultured Aquitalea sp.]|uniref:HypC/HybG/HupF family hydrogenase formation chaperone n=1 Tax=uncultured Aquitalea sp. TaxID=540272 RepID=UPI0025E7D87F|nr:HypC/HybG/HupF family hydrogenase formation chaperone [uncultured Aquitalea sp.]
MCLAMPVRITELLPDEMARVDVDGVGREVSVALIDQAQVGDYVILHVGYAIGKLDPAEAARTLALMEELAAGEERA